MMKIQGLEAYSRKEILDIVKEYVYNKISEYDLDIDIIDLEIIGSRVKWTARDDSDLDIILEYTGDYKEYTVFNILNDIEDNLYIEDIPVDINPINAKYSGTLLDWLKKHEYI